MPFCEWTLRATKPRPSTYPASLSTIGDHIRARRLDRGLTQLEAGRLIGVDESTVWNWERGLTAPNLHAMPGVVRFLDYDPTKPATSAGAAIVQFRRSRGMSQERLAAALGVDAGTLGRWERGVSRPEGSVLGRVQKTRVWRVALGSLSPWSQPGHGVLED